MVAVVAVLVLTVVLAAGAAVVVNGRVCPCHEIATIYFGGSVRICWVFCGLQSMGFCRGPAPSTTVRTPGYAAHPT